MEILKSIQKKTFVRCLKKFIIKKESDFTSDDIEILIVVQQFLRMFYIYIPI